MSGSAAIGAMAAGLAFALGTGEFGSYAADRRILFAAMFAAFAALLTALALTYLAELLRRRPVVRIDGAGLFDRRLSPAPIPWPAIRGVLPVQHGMQLRLALDVADPQAFALPHVPVWWLNRRAARLLGYPELSLRITGLDADLFAVMAAIAAQREPG